MTSRSSAPVAGSIVNMTPAFTDEERRPAPAPRTFGKVSFMPANDASSVSSAVAEERTATAASAPRELYAARISRSRSGGKRLLVDERDVDDPSRLQDAAREAREPFERSGEPSAQAAVVAELAYAAAPTTNPLGTGSRARVSSPRFAPLPPAKAMSSRERSANRR
jgi:hypothetical protein